MGGGPPLRPLQPRWWWWPPTPLALEGYAASAAAPAVAAVGTPSHWTPKLPLREEEEEEDHHRDEKEEEKDDDEGEDEEDHHPLYSPYPFSRFPAVEVREWGPWVGQSIPKTHKRMTKRVGQGVVKGGQEAAARCTPIEGCRHRTSPGEDGRRHALPLLLLLLLLQ